MKVDVDMLNTMKNYWDDVLSVSPLSEQKEGLLYSDEGLMLKTSAQ